MTHITKIYSRKVGSGLVVVKCPGEGNGGMHAKASMTSIEPQIHSLALARTRI